MRKGPTSKIRRKRCFALVVVLSLLGVVTVLITAVLSLSYSEQRLSNSFNSMVEAGQLAEISKGIVINQIRKGTQFSPRDGIGWASQPGAIRTYKAAGGRSRGSGLFNGAFKLYSDSAMDVEDEWHLARDAPPDDWADYPQRYVDLNEPVVRTYAHGVETHFPIFDPKAAFDDPDTDQVESVEGFSFDSDFAGMESDDDPQNWRLPMPVEWLYVLRDGTVGFLDDDNRFVPNGLATEENPIEGRIAFWADDESCKININTASEPTHWATPHLADRADWGWAKIQPARGEYQRFPGHPATTAISPVLFPNQEFAEPAVPDNRGKMMFEDIELARASAKEKGKIYQWAPKIQDIGSRAGTEFMWHERGGAGNQSLYRFYPEEYDPKTAGTERLFASVDEFLLNQQRAENDFSFTNFEDGTGGDSGTEVLDWVNAVKLGKTRGFLTHCSRAPEVTMFGTPRICMWPLHTRPDEGDGYRTHFDQLIARCSTLGEMAQGQATFDNSYYFRREDSTSPETDINLRRNRALLRYLQRLTSREIPGFGGSFRTKYKEDRNQLLVQIFDYIRATNTLDPLLASLDRESTGKEYEYKTFTAGKKRRKLGKDWVADWREGISTFEFGHGHVTPSYQHDWDARGLGRALTLDEVAMMFICCADGTPNEINQFKNDDAIEDQWSGGGAGWHYWSEMNPDDPNEFDTTRKRKVVYSNFPPNPEGEPYGPRNRRVKNGDEESTHPGYKEVNWNYCLEDNTPLEQGTKRIQGMMLLDWFTTAPGFNPLVARYGAKVKGLRHLKVNGESIFPDDEVTIWGDASADPNAHKSPGVFYKNKLVEGRDPMPADEHKNLVGKTNGLVTNFLDITGDSMTFGATGPVTIEILTQQNDDQPVEEIQTVVIRFPDPKPIPVPNLVTVGRTGSHSYNPDREPPQISDPPVPEGWGEIKKEDGTTWGDGDYGRWHNFDPQAFYFWSFYRAGYNLKYHYGGRMARPHQGASNPGFGNYIHHLPDKDVVFSMMPWHGDHRLVAARRVVDYDPFSPYTNGGSWVFAPVPGAADAADNNFGQYFLDHKFRHSLNGIRKAMNRNPLVDFQLAGLPWEAHGWGAPHFPFNLETQTLSSRFGDFDIGIGNLQGGPFINKPDEGNLVATTTGTDGTGKLALTFDKDGNLLVGKGINSIPYFASLGSLVESLDGSFSPNRMVPSPAVMGSLPTGVKSNDPWRTLLLRPDSGFNISTGKVTKHPGTATPPDHLLLDLFWMPVVEPYAISEPFSTAGKINLNYQILPFKHIRRATALHGLLKGERITAAPVADDLRRERTFANLVSRSAVGNVNLNKYVHREIDVEETLEAFDEKFEREQTLFRTASQICEMHLVPEVEDLPSKIKDGSFADKNAHTETRMRDFWRTNRGTSDNLRERPYANIYSRITTKTNTWRIHFRVQTVSKARSTAPDTFDPEFDSVTAEQRGSTLVERFINPNHSDFPDFATDPEATLEKEYQFREVGTRRFMP